MYCAAPLMVEPIDGGVGVGGVVCVQVKNVDGPLVDAILMVALVSERVEQYLIFVVSP